MPGVRRAAESRGPPLSASQRVRPLTETRPGAARIRVRRIRPDESDLLREIRLRSLADSPEAFGTRLEEAQAQSDGEWRAAARASSVGNRRAWFVAERIDGDDAAPVGLVQARRRPPESCLLFSMWVDPAARRAGVGRKLLDAVEDWAREWGGREIVLWVFPSNEGAIRLYESSGFERVTEGADAESGRNWDAIAMRRPVRD